MKKVEFVPLLLTERTDIYTIRIDEAQNTEFRKFFIMFKDVEDPYLKDDLGRIMAAIEKISQNGALESYFRVEGKINDRVCAIPMLIKSRSKSKRGTLRVYCIRVSDSLLIIGGGGLKVSEKYEDNPILQHHVETLQTIDLELKDLEDFNVDLNNSIVNLTVQID